MTLFLVPFAVVGLGVLATLPHTFIAIFSPYFKLALSPGNLTPGTRVTAQWTQIGGSGIMDEMTLTLIGEEVATYKQGTDTRTAKSSFHHQLLKQSTRRDEIVNGRTEFVIPADSLPSFESDHNEVRWFLLHEVKVSKRPDVRDEVPLTIHPHSESDFR